MTTTETERTEVPTEAIQPDALNHLVLNCTNLERSHAFWSGILGFKEVVNMANPDGHVRARFYRSRDGTQHHDLALFEIPDMQHAAAIEEWTMAARQLGVNHIAIKWKDRETWLKQIAFMQSQGIKFHVRTEHGMTHSAYVSDPDGYGIEVLYEVPREAWIDNPGAAVIWGRRQPNEGPEALIDNDDYHVFKSTDPVVPDFGPAPR